MFLLKSSFRPTGDQPNAIAKLTKNIKSGVRHQTLLGVTGSGKTFTVANTIAKTNRPALIIEPNKTLAAQIYQELKSFFPNNGVHYFVSYYDYYQPEAYIPQTDTYIEKDAKINETIDRLRHGAVQDVLSRRDVIVVASVSCIYNIGSPEEYQNVSLDIKTGQIASRRELISRLTALQYQRNDLDLNPGTFRARGNVVEIFSATGKEIFHIEFEGNTIAQITKLGGNKNHKISNFRLRITNFKLYPAKFWITPQDKLEIALANIRSELQERLAELKKKNKLLEAERLERRTNYDLEMIEQSGYCHGIENYSRHLEFREPGEPPFTLLDYFPNDFIVFIDESHLTIPQLNAMAVQDRKRKEALIEYGFRLPSARDNRPLTFKEFEEKVSQTIYVSATPAAFEKKVCGKKYIVEQLIRPTGLLEPSVEIRPTKNQLQNLILEIKSLARKNQRALVVTLTKRLAEELADYFAREKIKAQWLHSEIKTLERPAILAQLREGKYDVIVGINLLREGLDLPEVALIAILDADKEGFLRNETTLIQTMGRAARHPEGHVILYADKMTLSMKNAIQEVARRRKVQQAYNKKYNITPRPIVKPIADWQFAVKEKALETELLAVRDLKLLEKEMRMAAKNLDFERAAEIRDLIQKLKYGT
jgi:excinuclease ABC subunit B